MPRTLLVGGIWLVACVAGPAVAFGDGGTVRLSERQGNYLITVFTSPTPLRTGPVDISVLVQHAASGEPASEVAVVVRLTAINRPEAVLTQSATAAAATNKLFRAAQFELPWPGRWRADISISGAAGPAEVHCELEAGNPLPPWLSLWPWILWPIIPIGLFGVHQFLVHRRHGPGSSAV